MSQTFKLAHKDFKIPNLTVLNTLLRHTGKTSEREDGPSGKIETFVKEQEGTEAKIYYLKLKRQACCWHFLSEKSYSVFSLISLEAHFSYIPTPSWRALRPESTTDVKYNLCDLIHTRSSFHCSAQCSCLLSSTPHSLPWWWSTKCILCFWILLPFVWTGLGNPYPVDKMQQKWGHVAVDSCHIEASS